MGRKGSGMGIAPTLSFWPTMSPFEKCREHILDDFFGTQSLSLLITRRQSSFIKLGIAKKWAGCSSLGKIDDDLQPFNAQNFSWHFVLLFWFETFMAEIFRC